MKKDTFNTYRYLVQAYDIKGRDLKPFEFYSNSLLNQELILITEMEMLLKMKKEGTIHSILNYLDYYDDIPTKANIKDFLYLDFTADGKGEYYIYLKNLHIESEKV